MLLPRKPVLAFHSSDSKVGEHKESSLYYNFFNFFFFPKDHTKLSIGVFFNSFIWHTGNLLHVFILAFATDHLSPIPSTCHLVAKILCRADFVCFGNGSPGLQAEGSMKHLNCAFHFLVLLIQCWMRYTCVMQLALGPSVITWNVSPVLVLFAFSFTKARTKISIHFLSFSLKRRRNLYIFRKKMLKIQFGFIL